MGIMSRAVVGMLLAFACACSSDSATEPEPTIDTPGAFVAFEEAPGQLRTIRILGGLQLDSGTILFITSYSPLLSSYDAAKEMAKSDAPPIELQYSSIGRNDIVSHPYRVVWFRTLSDEEKELLP